MAFPIGAIPLTGGIGLTDITDVFPTHFDTLQEGGMRAVLDDTERDAITLERRKFGMLVFSVGSNTCYVLANASMGGADNNLSNNANWIVFSGGGSGGITSLNTLTAATQTFATGTTGTDFNISSSGSTHTFNIPTASSTVRGLLSSTDWSTFDSKLTTVAVDGVTITGDGTVGNPLVASTGGGGTVTNVATGTGLTGGPITTTGTISLANTAVTPGSYTLANITVDAQGRITAASNGSAGGITLETNGTPNTVQTLLNLIAGTNITLTENGLGGVTSDAASGSITGPATEVLYFDPVGGPTATVVSDAGFTNTGLAGTLNITKDDGAGNVSTTNFSPTQNDEDITDGSNNYNIRKNATGYRETTADGTNTNTLSITATDEYLSVTDGTNIAQRLTAISGITDNFNDTTNTAQTTFDATAHEDLYSNGTINSKMRLFGKNAVIESEEPSVTRGECRATFQGGSVSGTDLVTGLKSGFSSGAASANIDLNDGTTNFQVRIKPTAQPTVGQVLEVTANPLANVFEMGFATPSGSSPTLETNGTPNGDQTLLNLVAGTNVTLTDDGSGNVTIDASGGGGSGTVTNVSTGTGLTGGPITTTGTISLANTAVTPGSYTNTNLTVDAQGRITAASNGTGGSTNTILNGSGPPSSGLGNDGDFYIDTVADVIYGPKTAGVWGSGTSLIGANGQGLNLYLFYAY